MLLGRSIPATGPWAGTTGGLHHQDAAAMQQFFTQYGLRPIGRDMSLRPALLQGWLCRGPVMLVSGFRAGAHNVGTHALVVAGVDGDTFRLLDPYPVGRGTEVAVTVQEFARRLPFNVFWAIQKA